MAGELMTVFRAMTGTSCGIAIGLGFGLVQRKARRRYELLEQRGELKSEWAVARGSTRRIAFLLLALALVQIVCPRLFVDGTQWWVSGGVVAGYGAILFRQLGKGRLHGFLL